MTKKNRSDRKPKKIHNEE